MQIIIHTEQDLRMLQGKFVLQIDIEKPDMKLMATMTKCRNR